MTAWWPRSLSSQIDTRTDRDQIEASIRLLKSPCDASWLMARILALLAPDFTLNMPEGVRRIEAEDWVAALREFPEWAIEKACRWWRSDENEDRRKKPMQGDIQERVKFEMGVLTFGAMKVAQYDRGIHERMREPEPEPISAEDMAARREFAQSVMQKCGFARSVNANKGPRRETVTDADKAEIAAMLAAKTPKVGAA